MENDWEGILFVLYINNVKVSLLCFKCFSEVIFILCCEIVRNVAQYVVMYEVN